MKKENVNEGKARNRKELREELNKKNNQGMQKWKVILLYFVVVGVAAFLMVGYADMKMSWIQEDGSKLAEELFSNMVKGEKLPWSANESKILAVIECEGYDSIFITKYDSVGEEVAGCEYHLAKNTEVTFSSKLFEREGLLHFQPKTTE